MTKLERLEAKLVNLQKQIIEERGKGTIGESSQNVRRKAAIKTGRPRIDPALILEMKIAAYKKPLPDVALQFGVALSTLYNYGITREALEAELREKAA